VQLYPNAFNGFSDEEEIDTDPFEGEEP
jgi:hypothetical protein